MPCAAHASARIHVSVRPAIAMPLERVADTEQISSNASDIARPPAPPVSTSVPSMSKRMAAKSASDSVSSRYLRCERCRRAALWPTALRRSDALAFIQLVEAALHRAAVKEPLLPAIVANEPKSPVPNESLDRAARHPSLLGRARAQGARISNFVPMSRWQISVSLSPSSAAQRRPT